MGTGPCVVDCWLLWAVNGFNLMVLDCHLKIRQSGMLVNVNFTPCAGWIKVGGYRLHNMEAYQSQFPDSSLAFLVCTFSDGKVGGYRLHNMEAY